jgi:hypothetical protein
MGSAVSSVMGGGGIESMISAAIGIAFPPAAIAMGVANLVTQGVGAAADGAASQLAKEGGMPSFLQDPISDLIKNVIKELKQDNDPECDEAAQEGFGKDIEELVQQMSKSIAEQAAQNCQDDEAVQGGKGGKGGGANSWLIALAKAMGQTAGKHADKLVELSNKMDAASSSQGKGGPSSEFTAAQSEFQAESQMFGMLQNAFTNALKSIGEGLSTMARKG